MMRILVSVSNDITHDQRLNRTCICLKEEGYDLAVIGRLKKNSAPISLPYETKRIKMLISKGFLFYAFFNLRLFFVLLFSKKDMLYANDLDTLLPNYLVSRLQSKPLIFDSHELFSEVPELETRKFSKRVWRFLEDALIPRLSYVIAVSRGIQCYYEEKYKIPVVLVRNIPMLQKVPKKTLPLVSKKQQIIWYQGAINVGRGLELMTDTMTLLNNHTLVIAGDGDILEALEQKVLQLALEDRVKFLGKLSPEELRQLTPNASLGISLEEDLGLNYRFALPNKVFDYIHAEIPVIVSDLPEMSALVKEYHVGEILGQRSPEKLADLIEKVTTTDYQKALKKAKKDLHWSLEKEQLINLVNAAK